MRLLSCSLVALLLAGSTVIAQDKPSIEVAGFSISKKDPSSEFGQGLSQMRSPGLEVDLYFVVPGATVLSLDNEQSKATLKSSDGTELPLTEQFDGLFDVSIREEGDRGIISFKSEELPPKKTTTLAIDGTFALIVGKDLKTVDSELKLMEGATVKMGPVEATVDSVGEAFGDPYKQTVQLSSKKPFDSIKSIEFLDAKGEVIESADAGSGSFGFNGDYTYNRSWQLASEAKSVKMRISYFAKTDTLKLPAKLEFGVGL